MSASCSDFADRTDRAWVTLGLELPSPLRPDPDWCRVVESRTLRPVVSAWAVAPDHSLLVGRDGERPEVGIMTASGRRYQRLAQLPLPAHQIVPAADGRWWLRCWPARMVQRARTRPFGRELLVLAPDGEVLRQLTMDRGLAQLLPSGPLMLVVAGGSLHAFDADGRLRWRRQVPGWSSSPERRVWSDPEGVRIWAADSGGISELDPLGKARWRATLTSPLAPAPVSEAQRRQAADLLGVAADAPARQLRRAFYRMAKATHPDHHPEEPHAAERFRAVAGAYRLLREAPSRGRHLADGVAVLVSDAVPAGQDEVWVATSSGSWHRLDSHGREVEQGQLRGGGPAALAVDSQGRLVAVGGAGLLEMGDRTQVPLPGGWDYRLRATQAGVVALGRDRLLLIGPDGSSQQSRLLRPAQAEWVATDLYLFCAEGDFRRLRPSSPAPPADPP